VLADLLEIPNLRDRSNRYLQRLVMDICLGMEVDPEPYMALWRRVLFVAYAVISYVYRWVITFVILTFMATFLKPYKLEVISTMLAVAAAGSMVGWPLFRLGKNLHKRGRLPDMKPTRTTITAAIVASLLLAFFFLPLPVSRVRQTGLVQVPPQYLETVHVEVPGILEKVHVREGQPVRKGAVLATFSSLEQQQQEEAAQSEYRIKFKLVQAYAEQIATVTDATEARNLQLQKTKAEGERDKAEKRLEQLREEGRRRLTLVSPRDGVVSGLPREDELKKLWQKDAAQPFCTVFDPRHLRVLVPVPPDDYELIRDNLKKTRARGEELEVTLRINGRGGQTWAGVVKVLPAAEAKEVPMALSQKAGGPLAVKPGQNPSQVVPQTQVYLVGIEITDPDVAICPGQLAQVKVHNEYRSLAWWSWRSLSKTFDLGLL
jgi:putative peptide zinc metalloprotease protein